MPGGSLDLIHKMFECADVGLAVLDTDLRIVAANQIFADLSGISPSDHRGKTLEELLPKLAPIMRPRARTVLDTGEGTPQLELIGELQSLPGKPSRWFASYWPLTDGGRVVGVSVRLHRAARDGVEDALRRNEAQFRAICDACPLGIFLTDEKGACLYSNPVNVAQLGGSLEEMLGDGWQRAIHPADRESVRAGYRAAMQSGAPYRGVFRYLHPDGRVVLVDVRATGIHDGQRLIGYVGIAEDITERAAAEATLRESELRFRQLAENIRSVFWLRPADRSELYYVSPAFEEIFGQPVAALQGRPELLADMIHPDDRDRVLAHIKERVGAAGEFEYRVVRPDGSVAWIVDRRFPVRDENGVVVRIAGIATDVTPQKKLEAELLQARKLDSLGRLAGGIAHDFNNLLTVIVNQSIMALRACDGTRAPREELELIQDAARQGTEVTRQLLAFARRQPFEPSPLDPNVLTETVARFLSRLVGERIEVEVALEPDVGIVRGDRAQLEQVIVNLALNARDAMPEGGKLRIHTTNLHHDGIACVAVIVSDTGRGIPEADRPHIFEPFFSTKSPNEGTGLGLASCYGIVKQHGGHVDIASAVGRGTTVSLYFPRIDAEATRRGAPEEQTPPRGSETILVVEDQANVRATTVSTLMDHGFVVLEANDGADALRVLEGRPVDLVLTDIVMPIVGGAELGKTILTRHPGLRVLYTSGYPYGSELRDDSGTPVPFLAKPYEPSTLLRRVRDVLDS
jgi:PAS domain S-box-containing protein